MEVAILLFDEFETLDVFGPVELFGRMNETYTIHFYSLHGGTIHNKHGVSLETSKLATITGDIEIFLIPGGMGTRKEVDNAALIDQIKELSNRSTFVLTVCTGSALLARTGLLNNKQATSNKRAFNWVVTNGPHVLWNETARWTVDGKYYTSSGVSAGMDMVLGFVSDRNGIEFARKMALEIEYFWMEDKNNDTFKSE